MRAVAVSSVAVASVLGLSLAAGSCGYSTNATGEFAFASDAAADAASEVAAYDAIDAATDAAWADSLADARLDAGDGPDGADGNDALADVVDGDEVEADVPPPPCTESGAKLFRGHCYFVIDATSWAPSRDQCRGAGAHLVEIDDDGENYFVYALDRGQDHWIDLSAAVTTTDPAKFHWQDGDMGTYRNWYAGDPHGDGSCVALRDAEGQWGDRNCSDSNKGICERE